LAETLIFAKFLVEGGANLGKASVLTFMLIVFEKYFIKFNFYSLKTKKYIEHFKGRFYKIQVFIFWLVFKICSGHKTQSQNKGLFFKIQDI